MGIFLVRTRKGPNSAINAMPYISGKYYPVRRIVFFLTEGVLIFSALVLMHLVFLGQEQFIDAVTVSVLRSGLVAVIFQLSLYFFDLYDLNVYSSFADTATRMTQAFGFGCIVLSGLYYLFPVVIIPLGIFWAGYFVICGALAAWRFFYVIALGRRFFAQPIIILGCGDLAGCIVHEVVDSLDSGYKIVAIVGGGEPQYDLHRIPFFRLGERKLDDLCGEYQAEMVIVALEDRRGTMPVEELIECKLDGVDIEAGIGFYEELASKLMVEKVNPDWIIFSQGFTIGRMNKVGKRFFDLALSAVGLILASPLMLLSAIVIKLESPGSIFYTQDRVGERGETFQVIKFRSMCQDAEKDGAVWAKKNDSRVTRFGNLIRKLRIDEIPQLFNVLKGEMSLVGPRPERPVFVKELAKKIPYYALRHNIKPGVTGWAQVCYPYGASEEDALRKLEYDLYYLKNLSLIMDLWIVFKTVKTVLFQKGAR